MLKKYSFLIIGLFFIWIFSAAIPPFQNTSNKASMQRGEKVYNKVCLPCHMADGGGVPNMNPPLIQTSYVLGDKTKLISIVLHGMTDRVAIDGDYYSNNMAPHNDLTDQQIADVLTFVRNNFGNKASAITPSEVRLVRFKKQ
ncbi:MAG: c-type cytochrome [Hydrotalea flava]|uniref:c-type cytochrome n=1 Tax=Hydrotalea TaxID=1004300 RepID=UPI0009440091|nr:MULTISPECIES: c-type cytochrome [Hydrotalea]MBY0346915.1 cytochrome c [Hydrotalea flava]NIM36265.1 c-type cytochrome [Hydrotalea flava]NIM39116.1 c-type cytochrome [Hydrotalea flava]NIN04351.1 c-type cytochrome [Hydrotalea flava]NIN15977.1 c-type cytochrome [Hydrotalea flava]